VGLVRGDVTKPCFALCIIDEVWRRRFPSHIVFLPKAETACFRLALASAGNIALRPLSFSCILGARLSHKVSFGRPSAPWNSACRNMRNISTLVIFTPCISITCASVRGYVPHRCLQQSPLHSFFYILFSLQWVRWIFPRSQTVNRSITANIMPTELCASHAMAHLYRIYQMSDTVR
jgi:hypothetical protein